MATINIPYGGQSVGVEVPDFAMESTQQDIRDAARYSGDVLAKIAGHMGISVQKQNELIGATEEVARETAAGNEKVNRSLSDLASKGIGLAPSAVNAISGLSGKEKLSDLIGGNGGIFGALGLGAMGAQVGTVFGIMEEFGASMGALRRTGAGFGANLMELREQAALVGIGMESLAKIVTENGAAIRSLGTTTGEGTKNFLDLTSGLREATRSAGFFGMRANEMAALLVDEVELRRQTRNETFLEAGQRAKLVDSMAENLRLNEISASLTGQDIQDRIKARNEFRRNTVVAAAARTMNQDQLDAQNEMIESLSALGPSAQGAVQHALANIVGGIPMDNANQAFTQLAAAASEQGIDLRGNLQELSEMVQAGVEPEEIKRRTQALVDQFKNAEVGPGFIARAAAGQEVAMAFLQTQQEAFSTGAQDIAETTSLVNTQLERFGSMTGSAAEQMSGYANQMDVAGQTLRNSMLQSILQTLDLDTQNVQGFNNFIDMVERMPNTEGFKNVLTFATEASYFATGAEGFLRMAGLGGEPENAVQAAQNVASMATFLARVAEAAGSGFGASAANAASVTNLAVEGARVAVPAANDTIRDENGNFLSVDELATKIAEATQSVWDNVFRGSPIDVNIRAAADGVFPSNQ